MIIRSSLRNEISDYGQRLMGYTAAMSFNYCQLCVTADPTSMMPVDVQIEGDARHFEDVADAVIHTKERDGDDITIDVYPKDISYIAPIMQAVITYHPEFKMSMETVEHEKTDDEETEMMYKYIRLVMPDVNKSRRDVLLELVKTYRDALNVQFEAMKVQTDANIAPKIIGVPKEEVDAVNEQLDKIHNQYVDMADQFTEEKKKQIEDAYQEYIKRHPEEAAVAQAETAANTPSESSEPSKQSESSEPSESSPAPKVFDNQSINLEW